MGIREQAKPSGRSVLVVDDQVETTVGVRAVLERAGHRVLTATTVPQAIAILEREAVQVLVADYFMPGMNGEELVRLVRERDSLIQIVLQTAYPADEPPYELLRRLAIQGYHDKADGAERLLLWVETGLRAYDQIAQLHVAERLKTELLANVSHEFRTPLNIVIGYVDLLREGTFGSCPPEANAVFDKVLGTAAYLLELAEEFLDLSRVEAGATHLRQEIVELTPLLRALGESFALLVRTKPVQFRADIPDALPTVVAEAAKLRIIMQNLLANAAKFTKEGHIRLSAEVVEGTRVAIRVSDTGPGIAREHQEIIFDTFHQLRPSDPEAKGVGLGLALARRFARMMGGDVTVDSTPGRGTVFTVLLPATPPARVPLEAQHVA
jgi:signal transduction histidine kinase